MAEPLHCPQCGTRITPYEHEIDPKTGQGACWKCGLPMEQVLSKQGIKELPPRRMSLSVAETELAALRAELERMKAEKATEKPYFTSEMMAKAGEKGLTSGTPEVRALLDKAAAQERDDQSLATEGAPISYAIAGDPGESGLAVSEVEAASPPPAINWKDRTPPSPHRGPGRPPTRK